MGQTVFTGIGTALITPFTETGVDWESYGRLIDWQIEQGIDALVAAGTSGEGSTLTMDEHKAVVRYTVERAAGLLQTRRPRTVAADYRRRGGGGWRNQQHRRYLHSVRREYC